MITIPRLLLAGSTTMLLTALTLPPGAAVAAVAADDFGQHVQHHAVEGMLDGECQPGMHRGYSGWIGHEDCG